MSDARALREAADFIEATSGIGVTTTDYAEGWYDGLTYALDELRSRADEAETLSPRTEP